MEGIERDDDLLRKFGLEDVVKKLNITPSRKTRFGISRWGVINANYNSLFVITPVQPVASYRFVNEEKDLRTTPQGLDATCDGYQIIELQAREGGVEFCVQSGGRRYHFYLRYRPPQLTRRRKDTTTS